MRSFIFIAAIFAFNTITAQSFTAETGYIYTGNSNKEFFGAFTIKSGTIKKSDKLDIYAETGRKFQATITKMTVNGNEVQSAKAGQNVSIDFTTTEDATTGNDYLRKGYQVYPKNFKTLATKTNNITGQPDKLTAVINGKAYRAASFNNAYYKKGLKKFAYNLPFVQFSFVNNDTTDTRSFLVQIFNPKEGTAAYGPESSELNFSGSEDGKMEHEKIYGYLKGSKDKFKITITKWENKGGNKIIISGKMEGEIFTTLGKKDSIKIENGVFENVEVTLFSEIVEIKK
jgi:hypothetical protein